MTEVLSAYRADPYSYREARVLADELGLSEPVAITLVRRGYRTPEAARAFLAADESHDPHEFNSMGRAVERLEAAIESGEHITVYGDFDADGVCATTILVGALRRLGAECDWLIPDRIADGYGLSAGNIEELAARGTQLLVTVDCGIVSVEEVALAKSLGMDVIVTDHHQPGEQQPDCLILHPALDGYPFKDLCGTAVAWKLACALRAASSEGSPGTPREGGPGDPSLDAASEADLDLVALATVADMVPLVGENRSLVKRGLKVARRGGRPGLRALMEAASCEPTQLDEGDLSFRLAPRINAAGRLHRADAGVELFLSEDPQRAAEIAMELSRANGERRTTQRRVDQAAEAALRELPDELREAPAYVLAGREWHPGVIGIVASRIAKRYHRPTIVIALDGEGGGRGSGRSIPGFDLLAGLQACSQHLAQFGGHRAAAGLQLREEDVEAFRLAFVEHATAVLRPEDLTRIEHVDAMVGGASLGLDLAEELSQLAPFGLGNPGVRLLVPAARVSEMRTMGEGRHTRFNLHSGAHQALGVAFGRSTLGIDEGESIDAAVKLEVNRWNGAVEPRIVLQELFQAELDGDDGDNVAAPAEDWAARFEAELAADPAAWTAPKADWKDEGKRRVIRSRSSAAAVIGELASTGEGVLALVADASRRAEMAKPGVRIAEEADLEREPDLACGFEHVVLVDPPCYAHSERLIAWPRDAGGFLHLTWGEQEWRLALEMLGARLAQRMELVAVFRELREAGEIDGEQLYEVLRGSGAHPRSPEAAARCVKVLSELELLQRWPYRTDGVFRVVSSEETDLERSAAFRAYGARYQEGRKYLEGRRQQWSSGSS